MTLEQLNSYLARDFGYFDGSTKSNWRVVWSTDEFEVRQTTHTREGFELLQPVFMRVPKYRQWANDKYILERCLPVPSFVDTDLVEPYSYEPIYTFDIPKEAGWSDTFYTACKYVIDVVQRAAAKSIGVRYKDPEIGHNPEETKEIQEAKLQRLENELFPNETDTGDALAHNQAVIVPRNFEASAQPTEENKKCH